MDYLKAIENRISRRTYQNEALDSGQMELLSKEIDLVNEESGLNIMILLDGSSAFDGITKSYGLFDGVKSLIVIKGNKNDDNLKEKAGYYGEMLILKATDMGLGTCWVAGTFDRTDSVFDVLEDEELVCVIPVGKVDKTKMKEKMLYNLMRRNTKDIKDMYKSSVELPDWFEDAMLAVQKAPSAKNTQKVKFEIDDKYVKAFVPDDYPMDMVDLGIAKLHFELSMGGKFEIGNGGVLNYAK